MSNISKYVLFLYPCTSLTVQGLLQRICSLSPWLVSQQVKDKRGYHQCSIAWPEYLLKPGSRITRTVRKKTPSYIHITISWNLDSRGKKTWNSSSFLGVVTFPKQLWDVVKISTKRYVQYVRIRKGPKGSGNCGLKPFKVYLLHRIYCLSNRFNRSHWSIGVELVYSVYSTMWCALSTVSTNLLPYTL